MSVTLLYSDRYLDYDFGPEHPFSPVRQRMLLSLLDALGAPVDAVAPPVATRADVRSVHSEAFVRAVEAASDGAASSESRSFGIGTQDVPAFEDMDAAARALVGGTLHGARRLASGNARRVLQLGGGLHHAQHALASGFCVYNDVSVAIRHLRDEGLRVAYIDIDVHHGDGVQALHYTDPNVLTVSLHESGRYLFPGTGSVDEMGEGAGDGTAVNVPLEPFTESDSYLEVFDRVVPYALQQFHPDVIVAQCGADAHFSDPLADLLLTTQAYASLFRQLFDLADTHADGRLLLTLGGGYRPDATVRIWALLALLARHHDVPADMPNAWRTRWQDELGDPLSATLHDSKKSFDVPRRDRVVQHNERVSKRVLERAAPKWY